MKKINGKLLDKIYENLRETLEREYFGKFVGITYDYKEGEVLAMSDDMMDLFKKLEKYYPSRKIFIKKVGAKAVAGWF